MEREPRDDLLSSYHYAVCLLILFHNRSDANARKIQQMDLVTPYHLAIIYPNEMRIYGALQGAHCF